MSAEPVPLNAFSTVLGTGIELSSVALGGEVVSVSDEFFAEASNLIKVEPAPSLKGQFGPKGALYSGWESRRHNETFDWCIIKLGAAGFISGFDIDTSHFNGNEAPAASVEALFDGESVPNSTNPGWTEILPRVNLGPNSRHLFSTSLHKSTPFNYVKLNMYPDGGIARFRVYGLVNAILRNPEESIDLAHVFSGGRVVFVSDQHFGVGPNLLLPGRGKDMGDGWETKRSRIKGHKDWVIIKLGVPGILEHAEIDTAHFMGNFPESCELHAVQSSELIPSVADSEWKQILPRTKLGPHRRHFFQLVNTAGNVYTHVRVTIHPDGGIKRVRMIGKQDTGGTHTYVQMPNEISTDHISSEERQASSLTVNGPLLSALPLTPEAFAPFGRVIQAYATAHAAPSTTKVTPANQGTASKFHKLALLRDIYPAGSGATTGISTYRCAPLQFDAADVAKNGWAVRLLERHQYTTQAFVSMGGCILKEAGDDALENPGDKYLVVVAQNVSAEDDRPDLESMKAFIAHAGQAIMYNAGVWHHPMVALERVMDFACVETQIGDGSVADCEIVELDVKKAGYPRVRLLL